MNLFDYESIEFLYQFLCVFCALRICHYLKLILVEKLFEVYQYSFVMIQIYRINQYNNQHTPEMISYRFINFLLDQISPIDDGLTIVMVLGIYRNFYRFLLKNELKILTFLGSSRFLRFIRFLKSWTIF